MFMTFVKTVMHKAKRIIVHANFIFYPTLLHNCNCYFTSRNLPHVHPVILLCASHIILVNFTFVNDIVDPHDPRKAKTFLHPRICPCP